MILSPAAWIRRIHKFIEQSVNRLRALRLVFEYCERYIRLATYYSNVIGVTKSPNQSDSEVVFWIDNANARYIITKPIHHTQKLLKTEDDGMVFSIRVTLNFELERELLGFGSKIKVLGPRILVKQIKQQLQNALERYPNFSQPLALDGEV